MSGYVRGAHLPAAVRIHINELRQALAAERQRTANLSKLLAPSQIKDRQPVKPDWNRIDWSTVAAQQSLHAAVIKYRTQFHEPPGTGLRRLAILDAEVKAHHARHRPATMSNHPAPIEPPSSLAA